MQSQGRRAALTSGLIAFVSAFVLVVGIGMAVMGASGYGRPTSAPTTCLLYTSDAADEQ